jgi:hypothetical protein
VEEIAAVDLNVWTTPVEFKVSVRLNPAQVPVYALGLGANCWLKSKPVSTNGSEVPPVTSFELKEAVIGRFVFRNTAAGLVGLKLIGFTCCLSIPSTLKVFVTLNSGFVVADFALIAIVPLVDVIAVLVAVVESSANIQLEELNNLKLVDP